MHRLACHHCGHVMPPPKACPECGEEDSLVACGPGVERIADEVAELFPEARTAIVTSDTIWSPLRAAEFVGAMEAARSTSSSAPSWSPRAITSPI